MKKTKMLTAAVIAAMVSLGSGYAWWTDALTITNNVSTGDLKVAVSDGTVTSASQYVAANAVADSKDSKGFSKSETVTINNAYPGAVTTITIPVSNIGTIGAKYNGTTVVNPASAWLDVAETPVQSLDVNGKANMTLTFTVKPEADVPQDKSATVTLTPQYKQFNQ